MLSLLLLWGCEKPAESPTTSRQITKKIIIAEKTAAKKPAALKPAAKQSDLSKSEVKTSAAVNTLPSETTPLYNPEGKIDPFEPLFKKANASIDVSKKKMKLRKPLTPLEKLNLSQLTLVGIIRAPSGNRALVQDASGKGYIVKKGTYIGTQSGKVDQILEDRIIVDEESEDIYGKFSMVKKTLKLQKPPGE
ncbi:MAG: pilus assembly protein PilP [Desulfobacterales bacterium]